MIWTIVTLVTLLVTTGTVAIVAVRLVQALRIIVALEDRLARLQEGTNLLTDTVELGFRQCAIELERLGAHVSQAAHLPVRSTPRPTAARVRAAAARGRSVQDIAADEQVSEGEVRLRLSLADSAAQPRTRAKGARNAPLRA
jgi:7-keto-8-aminopelargonate synthetase-like enzyme